MLPMPDAPAFLNNLGRLYRLAERKPKFILISFPHNPTTICAGPFFRDIMALAKPLLAARTVIDFAYAIWDSTASEAFKHSTGGRRERGHVEIFSMSKSYNMAGWRVGFCLGNPRLIAALTRIKSYLDYGVFQPIQIAAATGLHECEEDTRKICAMYQKRRDACAGEGARSSGLAGRNRAAMFLWAAIRNASRLGRSNSRCACWIKCTWRCLRRA